MTDVNELLNLTACELQGELIQPTSKIFIRGYGTIQNISLNKLRMLFKAKRSNYIIENSKDLLDDCIEVITGGWGKKFMHFDVVVFLNFTSCSLLFLYFMSPFTSGVEWR